MAKRKIVHGHTENRADQLVKTPTKKRGTYTYEFHEAETIGGKTREYTEKIEVVPGEDGVTETHIRQAYAVEDHEVYENLKARRPQRTDEEKVQIAAWKANYISKFKARHGYEPNPADVNDAADEAFPKNWTASLDEILDGDGDNDSAVGDKSAILAKAYRSSNSEPGAMEKMDEIAETWPESWQEIYVRVLKNKETIVSLARERDVTEGAVRKTLRKILKALAEDKELRKFVRSFDRGGTDSHISI